MASEGPNSPTTGANIEYFRKDWVDPGNITADDALYASLTFDAIDQEADGLRATDFGFSIPSGATIDGIVVGVLRYSTEPDAVNDLAVYIVKGGSTTGDNKAGGNWSDSWETAIYGGTSDKWGTTWAPADINASTFGFEIRPRDNGTWGDEIAFVDHITITVHYTTASGTKTLMTLGVGP